MDAAVAGGWARLALECVHREYPNHPLTLLLDDGDVRPPRDHTPAFFGCFDWHSAVHGHWTLVRLLRCFPDAAWAEEARAALERTLTRENLAAEVRHLSKPGREGFERPYGLAWLLQLAAELREWEAEEARRPREEAEHPKRGSGSAETRAGADRGCISFVAAIEPLERLCRERLAEWLPKLPYPIRSGEHSQTAFAMGLGWDWATRAGDVEFRELLRERAQTFYGEDVDLPLRFEPSGHDFLSPALAEADLLRRLLPRDEFRAWLARALPPQHVVLSPVASPDRSDGKLAHLDGLNLSRAWMLEGIASALEEGEPRQGAFARLAEEHAAVGLAAVTGEHYAGGHWLGTFAVYLMTRRGLSGA
jgi:hypothetical protein